MSEITFNKFNKFDKTLMIEICSEIDLSDLLEKIPVKHVIAYYGTEEILDHLSVSDICRTKDCNELLQEIGEEAAKKYFNLIDGEGN